MTPLARLAAELLAEGGLLADAVVRDAERPDAAPRGARGERDGSLSAATAGSAAEPDRARAVTAGASAVGADGDRTDAAESSTAADEYALLIEAIREGHLLHSAEGRVVRPADPDLALLAGDRLYALGLDRLARLGDLEAVTLLADVISQCAQAQAEGDPARAAEAWARAERLVPRAAE